MDNEFDTLNINNNFLSISKPKSTFSLDKNFYFQVHLPTPMPNWFWRMMQFLVFGIRWRKYTE